MGMRDENPTGVPEALMLDNGRARGGGVQAQRAGLLVSKGAAADREAWELLSPGVMLSAKTFALSCMAVASTLPTKHAGAISGFPVVGRTKWAASPSPLVPLEWGLPWVWYLVACASWITDPLACQVPFLSTWLHIPETGASSYLSPSLAWLKSCWSPCCGWQSAHPPLHPACPV